MRTVHEVSLLSGVSIRTLQYYDRIGLLHPSAYSQSGYRLYDDAAIEKLQQILLFRELAFPLREISKIVNDPAFDRNRALEKQIEMLTMQKERLADLISFARELQTNGGKLMEDFKAFDKSKLEEYAAAAKAQWGATQEYSEYEQKANHRSQKAEMQLGSQMMDIFSAFGNIRTTDPASASAQTLVQKLQAFISEHFYDCSDEILCQLGEMYASGGEFTKNIDRAGGEGTAQFVHQAIQIHCK